MADEIPRALELERQARAAAEARCAEVQERLLDAEQRAARVPELELELRRLSVATRAAIERTRAERDEARELLERSARVQEEILSSPSWRITAPLRAAKRRLR